MNPAVSGSDAGALFRNLGVVHRDVTAHTARHLSVLLVCVAVVLWPSGATAQRRVWTARLTPVPVDTVTVRTIVGLGDATVVLEGSTLTVSGKFEMNSPATAAHLHRAPKGLRGPNVLDLNVTKAASGTLGGTLQLTRTQIEDLDKEWYYVQIHSERYTDGQLRGWLLK